MTRTTRRYGKVALLMAGIVLASVLLTQFTGVRQEATGKTRIVASFYPVYIAALNLTQGADVEVVSLTGPTTGCLHDYQLSPENRIVLSEASLLLLNGAGAESFLDDVLQDMPTLPVVATSAGIDLREAGETAHHEDHDHGEGTLFNEHIWTSPARYAKQVENMRDGLCRYDPANAARYTENAARYLAAIEEMGDRLRQTVADLPYTACITFHDSLAYMAEDWGLQTVAALSMGEEGGVSASALEQAEQQAAAAGRVLLLYDDQYPVEYAYVGSSAQQSRVLVLRTGVSGQEDKDAWLDAMAYNLQVLQGEEGEANA